MKLNEIYPYDPDPSNNNVGEFARPIIEDLEDALRLDLNFYRGEFRAVFEDDEEIRFRFSYKVPPRRGGNHHRKVGDFLIINAHSVVMTNVFPPERHMNLGDLIDDPGTEEEFEIKKPPSYFERNPEKLAEVLRVMQRNGADACTADPGLVSVDMDNSANAFEVFKKARKRTNTDFRLDFLFLTEPIQKD